MPELLETGRDRQLDPGDVLMISRKMRDKDTGKRFWWRFFVVVVKHKRWTIHGRRVGAPEGKEEISLTFDDDWVIHYLPMEEWPDGLHAFRMAMVLKGLIPDVV